MPVTMTDRAINKAMNEAKASNARLVLTDAAQSGLRLRISQNAIGTWNLNCRDALGKMRSFPLGRYPALGISDARAACRTLYERVRQGHDPIADKRTKRAVAQAGGDMTLPRLIDSYLPHAPKSFARALPTIRLVYADLLDKPLSEITRESVNLCGLSYHAKPSANYACRSLSPVFSFAADTIAGFDARLVNLKKPHKIQSKRTRFLSQEELERLLPIISKSDANMHGKAMYFILLTMTRLNETCEAKWSEIDLDAGIWTINKSRIKKTKKESTSRDHVIELSSQAIELLKGLKSNRDKTDYVFQNIDGNKLSNWDKATKKLFELTETSGWHRHDLRRTSATRMGNLSVQAHVIEACLNHAVIHSDLASTYNQSRYQDEQATAFQLLANDYSKLIRL